MIRPRYDRFNNQRRSTLKQSNVSNETMRLVDLKLLRGSFGHSLDKMAGLLKIEPLLLKAMEEGTIEPKQDLLHRIKLLILGEI